MTNFRINPNPRGGWLVIEHDKAIESIQIFFTDEEFLKAVGAVSINEAIELFSQAAKRKNLTTIIFNYCEFAKWDLRYWDNQFEVLENGTRLAWIEKW